MVFVIVYQFTLGPRLLGVSGRCGARIPGNGPCASGRLAAGHANRFYRNRAVYEIAHSGPRHVIALRGTAPQRIAPGDSASPGPELERVAEISRRLMTSDVGNHRPPAECFGSARHRESRRVEAHRKVSYHNKLAAEAVGRM